MFLSFENISAVLVRIRTCEIVVCPIVFFEVWKVPVTLLRGTSIQFGATNLHLAKEGALYRGEVFFPLRRGSEPSGCCT